MNLLKNKRGFTLIEALVVIAIIGIVALAASPSSHSRVARERLIAVAEMVASDLQSARSESIKRNTPITMTFTSGPSWKYEMNSTTAVVLPIVCPEPATSIKAVCSSNSKDFKGVSLTQNFDDNDMVFNNVRGISDQDGDITLSSSVGKLNVRLSTLGRVRICSPTNNIRGYPAC